MITHLSQSLSSAWFLPPLPSFRPLPRLSVSRGTISVEVVQLSCKDCISGSSRNVTCRVIASAALSTLALSDAEMSSTYTTRSLSRECLGDGPRELPSDAPGSYFGPTLDVLR